MYPNEDYKINEKRNWIKLYVMGFDQISLRLICSFFSNFEYRIQKQISFSWFENSFEFVWVLSIGSENGFKFFRVSVTGSEKANIFFGFWFHIQKRAWLISDFSYLGFIATFHYIYIYYNFEVLTKVICILIKFFSLKKLQIIVWGSQSSLIVHLWKILLLYDFFLHILS